MRSWASFRTSLPQIPHLYKRDNNSTDLKLHLCKVPGPKGVCPASSLTSTLPPSTMTAYAGVHTTKQEGRDRGTTSRRPTKSLNGGYFFLFERREPRPSSWSDSLHLFICDVPDSQGKVHFKDHFIRAAGKTSEHFAVKSVLLMISADALSRAPELGRREVGWAVQQFGAPSL